MDPARAFPLVIYMFYWCSLGAVTISRYKRQSLTCDKNSYACSSGTCIDKDKVCDGKFDCSDESDESDLACECGISYSALTKRNSPNAPGVFDAGFGGHPWHAGIYRVRANNHHTLMCSATLVYPEAILTTASCLFDPETLRPIDPPAVKVALGTLIRDFNTYESTQQKFNVSEILLLDGYEGDTKSYVRNLALLRLDSRVIVDTYVRPICLWKEKKLPSSVSKAWITGWGLQYSGNYALNLRKAQVGYLDVLKCLQTHPEPLLKRFLTHDKFCVTFDQEVGIREDDTGGGVSIVKQDKYYLIGVLSVKLPGTPSFAITTGTYKYLNWIRNKVHQFRKQSICSQIKNPFYCDSDKCLKLDQVCDSKRDCDDGTDEEQSNCFSQNQDYADDKGRCEIPDGKEIYEVTNCTHPKGCHSRYYAPDQTSFKVRCPEGYGFEKPEDTSISTICFKGTWFPQVNNPCRKLCHPIESKSLLLRCHYLGQPVSCRETLRPFTSIHVECLSHYKREAQAVFINETTCRADGSIAHVLTNCIPVCGVPNDIDKGQVLISNGKISKPGKFPWHIALYWKEHGAWEYKCGGTIISSDKILTAAHCLFDPATNEFVNENNLAVISGKYHSNWLYKDPLEQRLSVRKIVIGEHYNGGATRHAQDIAVLVLSKDLELNSHTLPACLDLDSRFGGIPTNQLGHVAGWGKINADDKEGSDILRETTLEYLDLDSCRKKFFKSTFKGFLLSDKFCVIYKNGSGTQVGDSGGGFTFTHNDLHYVYGVVSIKPKDSDEFAAFTNVLWHGQWLKRVLATNYN